MTLRQLFELIPDVWAAYQPWLPLRTAKDFLTAMGHPGDPLLGGGHWAAAGYVAAAAVLLLGVSTAAAHRRAATATIRRHPSLRVTSVGLRPSAA